MMEPCLLYPLTSGIEALNDNERFGMVKGIFLNTDISVNKPLKTVLNIVYLCFSCYLIKAIEV